MNNKFPHLKFSFDRLGRTILHMIVQYDLFEALSFIEFKLEDYLMKDMNGDTPMDYCYIYNSFNSFKMIFEKENFFEFYKYIAGLNSRYIENCLI